jgi:hypothetical protein
LKSPFRGFRGKGAVDLDKDLEYWVSLCLTYNPKAKASKKKAKAKAEEK